MKCWKCGADCTELLSQGKVSFRSECDKCHAWLHCCCNCKFYKPGMANDCIIPGTEYIADRASANFCEEFKLLEKNPEKPLQDGGNQFKDLFKE